MSGAVPPPQPPSDPNQPPGYSGGAGPNDPTSYTGPPSGAGGTGPTGTAVPAGPDAYQPDPSEVGASPTSGGYSDPNAPQAPPAGTYGDPAPTSGGYAQTSPPASSSTSMSGAQAKTALQNAHKFDLGIIACGLLAFLFSLFPYYTVSVEGVGAFGGISDSATAWHGFFGWFATLLALAAAVVVLLSLLGIKLPIPTRLAALGLFAAATLFTLIALFVFPGGTDCQGVEACEDAVDFGRGFGYWASLLVILGGTALAFMRKDAKD